MRNVPLGWAAWLLLALVLTSAKVCWSVEDEVSLDVALPTPPGTLFICGGGDVPDSVMLHFIELAGGAEARIVYIPTAARGADTDEADEDLEFFRNQRLASLTVVHTRSRQTANDPEFARPLKDATGVWIGGGCQRLLTDAYLGTTAEQLIRWVLDRGGVVGGISAGAAVMSPVMIRGGDREPEVGQGFGFLPGTVIDQHFLTRNRQQRLMRVLSTHPGMVGIGIDEGTALIVRGHRLCVMGDSDVVTCLSASHNLPAQVERLKPGDEADLVELIRAALARARIQLATDTSAEAAPTAELPAAAAESGMPISTPDQSVSIAASKGNGGQAPLLKSTRNRTASVTSAPSVGSPSPSPVKPAVRPAPPVRPAPRRYTSHRRPVPRRLPRM